jgi:hypothetical protein
VCWHGGCFKIFQYGLGIRVYGKGHRFYNERNNVLIALAIQTKVTVRELEMMQIATRPLLTSATTVHPLINAAHQALAKLRSTIKQDPVTMSMVA